MAVRYPFFRGYSRQPLLDACRQLYRSTHRKHSLPGYPARVGTPRPDVLARCGCRDHRFRA